MARGLVVVCIGALLTVSVVGFSLPYSGPLSDRDLDALAGGTATGWCDTCYPCEDDVECDEDPDSCDGLNVDDPCGPGVSNNGASPETCSSVAGDSYCDPSGGTEDVVCKVEYSCLCVDPGGGADLECKPENSSRTEYGTQITKDALMDPPICGSGSFTNAIDFESCD